MKTITKIISLIGIIAIVQSCKKADTPSVVPPVVTPTVTALTLTDFNPKAANVGSDITITGTGFGTDTSAVFIAVGSSTYVHPNKVTPTSMVFKTNLIMTGGKVTVEIKNEKVISTAEFTQTFTSVLTVYGFANDNGGYTSGQIYDAGHVIGTGFGTDINAVKVSFGGSVPIKPKTVNNDRMTLNVPPDAKSGPFTVSVNGSAPVTAQFSFTVNFSMIDFTPKTFSSGDTVKITGVVFTTISDMFVNFNATSGISKPFKVTPTEMLVVVPTNAKSGFLKISNLSGDYSYSQDKFTFIPRVNFNNVFTPSSGKVNDIIRINGDFTGSDISTIDISFGGSKTVKPTSINGPDIYVKIPADAKTGKITISQTGYAPLTGSFIFTIVP